MARVKRKSSARADIAAEIARPTTRAYAASLIAFIGVTSIFTMTLIAPALAPPSLGPESNPRTTPSLLAEGQKTTTEDAGKQLAVRTGGFSLFFHRRLPLLLPSAGGADNTFFKTQDTALAIYLLVPTAIAAILLVSLIWSLVFNDINETSMAQKSSALVFDNSRNLYSSEIFVHENALFTQKMTSASSSPSSPTLVVEERTAAVAAKESEEEIITLATPPRLPESQLPSSYTMTATPFSATETVSAEEENSPNSTYTGITTATTSSLSLGPRASLKFPSAHSPAARVPTHKTQFFTTNTPPNPQKTIENDAFVQGEDSDVYREIDNTGIWEAAPIRIEPTPATVHAVAGEDDATTTENEEGAGERKPQKPHWKVDDLKKELKATQEIVAALKIELSKGKR